MHMLLLKKQSNHRQALSFHGIYFLQYYSMLLIHPKSQKYMQISSEFAILQSK